MLTCPDSLELSREKIARLDSAFFCFVEQNASQSGASLLLKYAGKIAPTDIELAAIQIDARKKGAKKIAALAPHSRFLFPSVLAAEQCTHAEVAILHSKLIEPGSSVLDMTCGLGMDAFAAARRGAKVKAFDIDPLKITVAEHNASLLGLSDISLVAADSLNWLKDNPQGFDTIIVDPARRGEGNKRIYALGECSPDVVSNKALLFNHCKQLIIKASPMLDIAEALRLFPEAAEILAVSLRGECKEVLIIVRPHEGPAILRAVALPSQGERREFSVNAT